jgi:hypothetical protein
VLVAEDFSTYIHDFYVRIETPDAAAYCGLLFREFAEARLLPDADENGARAFGGRDAENQPGGGRDAENQPGGVDFNKKTARNSTLAFVVPRTPEGEFSKRLARINGGVPGSGTGFVARLL